MFPRRYFGARYFAPRYFAESQGGAPVVPVSAGELPYRPYLVIDPVRDPVRDPRNNDFLR